MLFVSVIKLAAGSPVRCASFSRCSLASSSMCSRLMSTCAEVISALVTSMRPSTPANRRSRSMLTSLSASLFSSSSDAIGRMSLSSWSIGQRAVESDLLAIVLQIQLRGFQCRARGANVVGLRKGIERAIATARCRPRAGRQESHRCSRRLSLHKVGKIGVPCFRNARGCALHIGGCDFYLVLFCSERSTAEAKEIWAEALDAVSIAPMPIPSQ